MVFEDRMEHVPQHAGGNKNSNYNVQR